MYAKTLRFKYVKHNLTQFQSVINYIRYNNRNQTLHNLTNNFNTYCINNTKKIKKYNNLVLKPSTHTKKKVSITFGDEYVARTDSVPGNKKKMTP